MRSKSSSRAPGGRCPTWPTLTLIWLLSISAASCSRSDSPPTLVHQLQCLSLPPPPVPRAVVEGMATEGCPSGYVCLTQQGAIALADWLSTVRGWVIAAWLRCGPVQGAENPSSSAAARPASYSAGAAAAAGALR